MTRENWLKHEVYKIKAGATIRQRCVMATGDRVELGLCLGDIPEARSKRGAFTCSAECHADRRRLQRWMRARNKCRLCGHGMTKKQREQMEQRREHATIHLHVSGRAEEAGPAPDRAVSG